MWLSPSSRLFNGSCGYCYAAGFVPAHPLTLRLVAPPERFAWCKSSPSIPSISVLLFMFGRVCPLGVSVVSSSHCAGSRSSHCLSTSSVVPRLFSGLLTISIISGKGPQGKLYRSTSSLQSGNNTIFGESFRRLTLKDRYSD